MDISRLHAHERPGSSTDAGEDHEDVVDVLVVGGGPAGLSAALVAGRSRRRVLVLDDGTPRNAAAAHMQGYLGHDGASPADFLALGRAEIARYGVRLRAGRVMRLLPETAGAGERATVTATLEDGTTVQARRVLVTTGLRDELPDIPGALERWGRDVLHCPYCHGWEVQGEAMIVVAAAVDEIDKAVTMRQWSSDVTVVLHGLADTEVPAAQRSRLDAVGIPVREGPVTALDLQDDRLTGVTLADGSHVPGTVLVVQPRVVARDDLLTQVGAEVASGPFGQFVITDETGATGVPGIWAAGNVAEPQAQVVIAAAAGYRAALAIDHDLIAEDVDRAVGRLHPSGPR